MKKTTKILLRLVVLSLFACSASGEKLSTSNSTQVSSIVIERVNIAGTDEELRMMLVDFTPAYSNVAHLHPADGLCYLINGDAESEYEGEDKKVLHAGDSFRDQANKEHLLFRNISNTEGLKFICTAKIKKDLQYLQPLPRAS